MNFVKNPVQGMSADDASPSASGSDLSSFMTRRNELARRHRTVQEAAIRARAEKERLTKVMATVSAEAMLKFNTSDPQELMEMAARMESEDVDALDKFELELSVAEGRLSAMEAGAA